METVKQIIKAHGFKSSKAMDVGDHIKVNVDGFMPLVIEKCGEQRLSVAHYHRQQGDLMRDPEVVFLIENEEWAPIEYYQDPAIHQQNSSGIEMDEFLTTWNSNIRKQGVPRRSCWG